MEIIYMTGKVEKAIKHESASLPAEGCERVLSLSSVIKRLGGNSDRSDVGLFVSQNSPSQP